MPGAWDAYSFVLSVGAHVCGRVELLASGGLIPSVRPFGELLATRLGPSPRVSNFGSALYQVFYPSFEAVNLQMTLFCLSLDRFWPRKSSPQLPQDSSVPASLLNTVLPKVDAITFPLSFLQFPA